MAEGSKIAHIVEKSRVNGNLAGDRILHKEREVQQKDGAKQITNRFIKTTYSASRALHVLNMPTADGIYLLHLLFFSQSLSRNLLMHRI